MNNTRNFCIIAHIDAGKSTLADRFLELTGTVEKRKMQEQFLDQMELERERGITIKLQPVRMIYGEYVLNLIDTPGHVDFSYEVSRSLATVEGAILLVDATKGVQAQTLANLHLAQAQKLAIIPVINKIDAPNARVQEAEEEICNLPAWPAGRLAVAPTDILKISAKDGTGVAAVLETVINKIPPPTPRSDLKEVQRSDLDGLKALIFDSTFDAYKGVIAYVRVFEGSVRAGNAITLFASKALADVIEVGIFTPQLKKTEVLHAGDIGYIATGLKDVGNVRVGDTVFKVEPLRNPKVQPWEPLAGYKEPVPVVFASFYPEDGEQYDELRDALGKLKLTDASLLYEPESSPGLGRGFRLGFLGMLHVEIVSERLRREFGLKLIISAPSVEYHIKLKAKTEKLKTSELIIRSAASLPDAGVIESIAEPMVALEILCPSEYLGALMKLTGEYRCRYEATSYLTRETVILKYIIPLAEIIADFYDRLKSISSGYASMSYQPSGYEVTDLVRLDILVAGDLIEPFSRVIPRQRAYDEGRRMVEKLKTVIPRQWFAVSLQAAIGGKIIARETIDALRKDVTGYLYGGDITRKMKLLEKQKKGKKKMKERGRIEIPQEVFLKMLKK